MDFVAIFALILAIIALVIIIIVIFIFTRDIELARSAIDTWDVFSGGTSSPANYNGAPNSIFVVNSGATNNPFEIQLTSYTNIATGVTSNSTTLFIIDNTAYANPAKVLPVSGGSVTGAKPNGVSGPEIVAAGTSGTFMWVNNSSVKRLS